MAKLIIAGEQRDASDGGTTEIRNPATGEIVDRVAAGTQRDVDNAIDAAETAFKKWSAVPPPQRAEILYKAAHLLTEREKDLAREGPGARPLFSEDRENLTYRKADWILDPYEGLPEKRDLIHFSVTVTEEDFDKLGDDEKQKQARLR